MDINTFNARAQAIRERYHALEIKQNGQPWSVEQDALAFLTDAALVGRLVMDKEESWPTSQTETSLAYKMGETIWWLASIAEAESIDLATAMEDFLRSREEHLGL
ncbi:hypothetical protein A5886_000912 [Enterococcus sp. 8G7_MSG3316]|uniref:MazG-like protein n=1 Tax=Candidatus Enterococcus testudinis TaxID=1834191 RepID=A0A242A475_9ENTE|nr:MazG-like protein [Enterococcus sp. 8G7_MSG3316]OTN75836.1 hypothetical protein A5886_000912 [Enterococcus sp. 8G7_MSG3316]